MRKHYIVQDGDVVHIEDRSAKDFNGNLFLTVHKDAAGRYSVTSCKGESFLFPLDTIHHLRSKADMSWWRVTSTYCDMKDIHKYGDVTYDLEEVNPSEKESLDFLFIVVP